MAYKISPIPHALILSTEIQSYTGLTSGQTVFFDYIYDINSGVTLTDRTKITFQSPGDYMFNVTSTLNQSATNNLYYDMWFQKNGVDIPWSDIKVKVPTFGNEVILNTCLIADFSVNDYLSLRWYCTSANGRLFGETGLTNPTRPNIPSVRITVNKMSE